MFDSLPYTTRDGDAADPRSAAAILYALSYCVHCAEAKRFLVESGVPFVMAELDTLAPEIRRPALHDLREIYGDRVVYPVLEVHGEYVFGYNRDVWERILSRIATG